MGNILQGVRRKVLYTAGMVAFFTMIPSGPVQAADASWQKGAGVAVYLDQTEKGDKKEKKTESGSGKEPDASGKAESGELVMAHVRNVLNVRSKPDENADIEGYLYADCGGTVLDQKDGWTRLRSGELTGWAKNEYLVFGSDAEEAARNTGRMVAKTTTGALRIRKEPSIDAGVYDLLEEGAEYEVVNDKQLAFSDGIEISDDWVAVDYEGKTGFVAAEFVKVEFLVDEGETKTRVEARKEEERKEEEARAVEVKKAKQQKEIEKTQAMAASDEVLLAALIQCEAGDEPYEGQVAVGAVVMNRVKSGAYPNTIKDVIFASGQFTPAGSGKLGRRVASGNVKASCLQAARDAIAGATPVGTATHFRRAGSREGIIIGHHVFW